MSRPKASRACTVTSGVSIAEVGRISARVATLFIGIRSVFLVGRLGQGRAAGYPARGEFPTARLGRWAGRSGRGAGRLGRPGGAAGADPLAQQAVGAVDVLQPVLRPAVAAIDV